MHRQVGFLKSSVTAVKLTLIAAGGLYLTGCDGFTAPGSAESASRRPASLEAQSHNGEGGIFEYGQIDEVTDTYIRGWACAAYDQFGVRRGVAPTFIALYFDDQYEGRAGYPELPTIPISFQPVESLAIANLCPIVDGESPNVMFRIEITDEMKTKYGGKRMGLMFGSYGPIWVGFMINGSNSFAMPTLGGGTGDTFDVNWYIQHNGDVAAAFGGDVKLSTEHWYAYGINEGRQGSPWFSSQEYLERYPYVGYSCQNSPYPCAVADFRDHPSRGAGVHALDPAVFDVEFYLNEYPDVNAAFAGDRKAATLHWLNYGINEGRWGTATFVAREYLEMNSDVAASVGAGNFLGAIRHYVLYGKNEQRVSSKPVCRITLRACANHPEFANRSFLDGRSPVTVTAASCKTRATEYLNWCVDTDYVTTEFFPNGTGPAHDSTTVSR